MLSYLVTSSTSISCACITLNLVVLEMHSRLLLLLQLLEFVSLALLVLLFYFCHISPAPALALIAASKSSAIVSTSYRSIEIPSLSLKQQLYEFLQRSIGSRRLYTLAPGIIFFIMKIEIKYRVSSSTMYQSSIIQYTISVKDYRSHFAGRVKF